MQKTVILIGGAPTSGKTTLSKLLSKHLDIPWISTDSIREIMQNTVSRSDYKYLFHDSYQDCEEYYGKFTLEQIVVNQNLESEDVWKGVKAFIDKSYPWKSFIIEGVAILPHIIAKEFKDNAAVKTIFLVDEDVERIRKAVFERGLWGPSKEYSDNVKEKEVEYIGLFNKYIRKEAENFGFPIIEIDKSGTALEEVLKKLEIV